MDKWESYPNHFIHFDSILKTKFDEGLKFQNPVL